MRLISTLGAFALMALAPALAAANPLLPPAGPGTALAVAAHDLSYAALQLSGILSCLGPGDHVFQDALTLYDAADHFEQEVLLGPEDLDVDFGMIMATFVEMRDELRAAPYIQQHLEARSAWFQTAEASLRLRITWFSHIPRPPC